MIKNNARIAAFLLTGALLVGTFSVSAATPGAGFTGYTSNIITSTTLPAAGVTAALSGSMLNREAGLSSTVTGNESVVVKAEYEDVAVAKVNDYVYVRSEASSDSEYVGKLYNKNAATVLEAVDGWYKIKSGKVEGYVSADYVVVGDKEAFEAATVRKAKVLENSLRVRSEASSESNIVTYVGVGDDLTVISEDTEGWVEVKTDEVNGFVSADYVELHTKYTYAESKEAEQKRIAAEKAAKEAEAARIAAEKAAAQKKKTTSKTETGIKAPGSKTGKAVANYACQFIGNPYVYGGTSLTKGADCSGFVMSVYKKFGVNLPHSSSAMRKVGKAVNQSSIAPGDIVCYSGHVGIYVGGGKMVNASSKKTGIKYTNIHYRKIVAIRRIF